MGIERIGSILLKSKSITQEELDTCVKMQENADSLEKLGSILKRYNFVSDEELGRALAKQVGWKYFDKKYVVNLKRVEEIGLDYLRDRLIVPVETNQGEAIVFAYPFDTETSIKTQEKEDSRVACYIGSQSDIRSCLETLINENKIKEIKDKIEQIKKEGLVGGNLKELLDLLLDSAINQQATDIHIEPEDRISAIRFRIDGILRFETCLSIKLHNNLVNVVFNKAEITVSDFLKFHDARFQHVYAHQAVDIRVSSVPSIHGPALVLRLLDANKTLIAMEKLGFQESHFKTIRSVSEKPHGIIIITGPTGSGKTTTLYAILNQLKGLSRKIITVEDPVEIKMPLINQVQINEKQGITFAHATRAFLRHDPNIILIGEIRDTDTAQEAIRAAITGHKVLSTLHTNDTVDAIYRLHDLGISLEHIANSVLCLVSQRLFRKLCVHCRKKVVVKKEKLPELFKKCLKEDENEVRIYKPKGCSCCQQGYRGRTVIAEVLCFNEHIRSMVSEDRLNLLREQIKKEGFISLEMDAARLVLEGVTSLEEAIRVAG